MQQRRSKGNEKSRAWGWEIGQHLVMAAHIFPLTVKLLLEKGRALHTDR